MTMTRREMMLGAGAVGATAVLGVGERRFRAVRLGTGPGSAPFFTIASGPMADEQKDALLCQHMTPFYLDGLTASDPEAEDRWSWPIRANVGREVEFAAPSGDVFAGAYALGREVRREMMARMGAYYGWDHGGYSYVYSRAGGVSMVASDCPCGFAHRLRSMAPPLSVIGPSRIGVRMSAREPWEMPRGWRRVRVIYDAGRAIGHITADGVRVTA